MKKFLCILLSALILTTSCYADLVLDGQEDDTVTAAEVVGQTVPTKENSLISLSYLTGTIQPQLMSQVSSYISGQTDALYAAFFYQMVQAAGEYNLRQVRDNTDLRQTEGSLRLKRGDRVHLDAGSTVVVQSGRGYASGSLSNITDGVAVSDGQSLPQNASCMAADYDSGFVVESETIQVVISGLYSLEASSEPDYNSTADALKALGLFKGDTSGYALERSATRIEALVMFLRLLGEENAALACTSSHPFTDVADWAAPYVAYAYEKGYTNGIGGGLFGSDNAVSPQDYFTFIFRALRYTEGTDFTWKTALEDAQRLSLITSAEASVISQSFLRAHVAYVSFYSLFNNVNGTGKTLLQTLQAAGAVTDPIPGCAKIVGTRVQ